MKNVAKPNSKSLVRKLRNLLLLMIGASMFSLVMVEALLWLVGFSYHTFWIPDPVLGGKLRPNLTAEYSVEGNSLVETNSRGFRDREWNQSKQEGSLRIAVLGDSYTEALQVPMEGTFCRVAENKLRSFFPGRTIEVMNFGVSGFGTAQALLSFSEYAKEYSPDIVVLAFLTGNDIRNNSPLLETEFRPFFLIGESGLELDNSFTNSPAYKRKMTPGYQFIAKVSKYSRIIQLTNKARHGIAKRRSSTPSTSVDENDDGGGSEGGLDTPVFRPPTDSKWVEAWKVTESLITRLDKEVRESGARLLVMTLTNAIQVNPDFELRSAFQQQNGIENLNYPDDRIEAYCQANNIGCLKLVELIDQEARKTGECHHGFPNSSPCGGHWNLNGHRVAGEALANELRSLGWMDGARE